MCETPLVALVDPAREPFGGQLARDFRALEPDLRHHRTRQRVAAPALGRTNFGAIVPLTWAAVVYSGVGALGLAYLFWYRGVRVIGSTRTAMFAQLQPMVALLAAWPLLGERPTVWQITGSVAVMSGLLLTRTASAAEPAHGE